MDQIENTLYQSRRRLILQELVTNTIYYPIVLILLELIPEGGRAFFLTDPAVYALIGAALLQAYWIGTWQYQGRPRPLLGNLIAPLVYTLVEIILEGSEFFEEPRHLAYWGFSLTIGILQELRYRIGGSAGRWMMALESMVRTSILLVGYWVFEAQTHPELSVSLGEFLSDDSHVFITLAVVFLGLALGFANITADSYLDALRRLAERLRQYSEWLLGPSILSQAIANPDSLGLQRRERAVFFMDIRGFTAWSEREPPEVVVSMLNRYYEASEPVWKKYAAIRAKHSADELMLIFASPQDALQAAREIRQVQRALLMQFGLSAGIGLHYGLLVEGVLGSKEVKGYDVIGDVVNTARRICDQAAGGEILVSEVVASAMTGQIHLLAPRQVTVKGKEAPLTVFPLVV